MAVYVIQNCATGSIKVGWSCDVAKRLANLQTASEHELALISSLPGGESEERTIHAKLAPHRIRGEWYRNTPEVAGLLSEMIASHLRASAAGVPVIDRPSAQPHAEKVVRWLTQQFQEQREWPGDELFDAAERAGIRRRALFEAKECGWLKGLFVRRNGRGFVWCVPDDWQPLAPDDGETPF